LVANHSDRHIESRSLRLSACSHRVIRVHEALGRSKRAARQTAGQHIIKIGCRESLQAGGVVGFESRHTVSEIAFRASCQSVFEPRQSRHKRAYVDAVALCFVMWNRTRGQLPGPRTPHFCRKLWSARVSAAGSTSILSLSERSSRNQL
jgi:hypothetical protein